MTITYIALGGAIGAVLRYIMTMQATKLLGTALPYGTLLVNIIGSFVMGLFIAYISKTMPDNEQLRAFIGIGLLGGFTTFSAFSLDTVNLIERGQLTQATIYVALSVFVSIVALFLGILIVK